MSESEIHRTVGVDGLIEFGQYLATLDEPGYRHYTFEIPDAAGRRRECSLEDAMHQFQDFCAGKADTFTIGIGYVDYQHEMIGRTDRTFTRRKQ
jgi:hypothetical protein